MNLMEVGCRLDLEVRLWSIKTWRDTSRTVKEVKLLLSANWKSYAASIGTTDDLE